MSDKKKDVEFDRTLGGATDAPLGILQPHAVDAPLGPAETNDDPPPKKTK